MLLSRLFLISLLISAFYFQSFSQEKIIEVDRIHCGSAIENNKRLAQNPLIKDIIEKQNKFAKEYAKSHVSNKSGTISYTIPVVYHVIHNNGPENVPKSVIEASIANLNQDYQKLNSNINQVVSAFTGIAADVEIQFRLAHIDPNGNCTEGITRTVSPLTYAMGEPVKDLINWNTTKYLNIWVGETVASGAGGYSYYPGTAPGQSHEGIVIRSAQLGNSVTHEVGHYLNLPHTWGSSNTPADPNNCNMDDGVADTPETIGNTSCNLAASTCGSLDNVQNYMEYSFCEAMFTEGQKTRMHAALNASWGSRNTLWTNTNLIATGTNDPYGVITCKPTADFDFDFDMVCEGDTVTYSDQSWGSDATAWAWTFNGGNPSTSSNQNPEISYPSAGTYSTTLVSSNSAPGSDTEIKTNIITVSSLTADYNNIPYSEGFENTTTFNNDWIILNPTGTNSWINATNAAYTGTNSVKINNWSASGSEDGDIDELISPSYDFSVVDSTILTYKWAYAKKGTVGQDKLVVYSSINCGQTWEIRAIKYAFLLETAPTTNLPFTPSSSSEWKSHTVDLSPLLGEQNVRFKFSFEAGGGNNIYLDDINLDGFVSVNNTENIISNYNVYPNPMKEKATISFNLDKPVKELSVSLKNVLGKEVTQIIKGKSFNTGSYKLKLASQNNLSSGIYFIVFNADNNIKVKKLIVK